MIHSSIQESWGSVLDKNNINFRICNWNQHGFNPCYCQFTFHMHKIITKNGSGGEETLAKKMLGVTFDLPKSNIGLREM